MKKNIDEINKMINLNKNIFNAYEDNFISILNS